MAEQEYEKKVNWTDPIVRRERTYPETPVIKKYNPGFDDNPEYKGENKENMNIGAVSSVGMDGIYIPIVSINGYVLQYEELSYMKLSSVGFTPSLVIEVIDATQKIRLMNNPGMSCKVTVIITMPIDGAYKKISCDFYAYKINYSGRFITYNCKYYCPTMERQLFTSWTVDTGKYPTTYELLDKISTDSGLGFQSTDKCIDVLDYRPRIARAQTFKDIIQQHVAFGGIDNKSIFDTWIDLYGYITLVNLPFIFDNDIPYDRLTTHVLLGDSNLVPVDNINTKKSVYTISVPRILTNKLGNNILNNMMFVESEPIVNNTSIMNQGTNNIYFAINGENSIVNELMTIVENSAMGLENKSNYTFDESDFLGCEYIQKDVSPILFQEKRHDMYLNKMRSKKLRVKLFKPNLGYVRGTLITLLMFEYNPLNKQKLIDIIKIAKGKIGENTILENFMTDNNLMGVMDITKTGMYYIDGIEFEYNIKTRKIDQYLLLINKGLYVDGMELIIGAINNLTSKNNEQQGKK